METKKNPSVDLTRKSTYYFSIGLFIATALAVMAFEWKQREAFIIIEPSVDNPGDPLLNIPITKDIPPQPQPIKINPTITEVPDNIKADSMFTFDPTKIDSLAQVPPVIEPPIVEEGGDEIVLIAEVPAVPSGGFAAFYKCISEHFKYPAQARRMGVEGKVYVEFIVNKDGSIVEVKTVKGIGAGLDEEAVRVIKDCPNWSPARQRGKPVRQRFTLPIFVTLS